MLKNIITLLIAVVVGYCATTVYSVELTGNNHVLVNKAEQEFIATADSLENIWVFVGRKISGGFYQIWIADSTGIQHSPTILYAPAANYSYTEVPVTFNPKVSVIKGVKYRLVMRHEYNDSLVDFYYADSNRYHYGRLIAQGITDTTLDLAARIEGVTWVPKIFGVETVAGHHDTLLHLWSQCFDSVKVASMQRERMIGKFWEWCQPESTSDCDFTVLPDSMMKKLSRDSIQAYISISNWPNWVIDKPNWYWPLRMLKPIIVNNQINRENWLGSYSYQLMKRYCTNGSFWQENPNVPYLPVTWFETINEPNIHVWSSKPDSAKDPQYDALWKRIYERVNHNEDSTYIYFRDTLFTRFCAVVDSAAYLANSDAKVLMGPLAQLWGYGGARCERGKYFFIRFLSFGGGPHCDGFSINAYQEKDTTIYSSFLKYFYPRYFHNVIDSFRALIREGGYFDKSIYVSEYGFPVRGNTYSTYKACANAVLEAYVEAIAPSENILGPIGNLTWFCFTERFFEWPDTFTITDRSFSGRPAYYAYKQLASRIKDMQFNSRIHLGDAASDTMARIYEFETPNSGERLWVAWRNHGYTSGTIDVKIPVRTSAGDTLSIDYGNNPSPVSKSLSTYGYMEISIDSSPVFMLEPTDSSFKRPDMTVDSIWTSPNPPQVNNPVRVYAKIKNAGSDSTKPGIPDSVIFYVDGVKKAWVVYDSAIHENSSVTVFRDSVWTPDTTRPYLVKVTVNGSRVFMELSFDNNAKYRMYNISYLPPTGSIVVNKDSAFTNLPAVSLYLQSYNPNRSGNQPADSMTIWEVIPPDTMVQLTFGYVPFDSFKYYRLSRLTRGKKKLCVKYRITEGGLESTIYADSIIFDWTPPESICFVVNHNRLFTATRSCTLCSSVTDSTSGICDMRFGNKQLANAIANSSCDDTSRWSRSNTDHDSSHKFFKVNSVSDQVSYLRQDIHKDTLAQWIDDGDTLLMSADLVTDHFVGTGNFRFQYLYGPPDPVKPDTVDTIITATDPVISQGSQAWVSRYNFPVALYFHPVPPNGTEFKKARVEVYVKSGGSNSGSITVDNVRLEPIKPEYNYSRFVSYDSIKTGWLLKAGNGRQTVFAHFQDSAGNETKVVWDTVVLDTTSPVCAITIPSDSQMVSSTLSIFGYAYDQSDTGRYFWKYNLDYRPDGNEIWYPIRPDSVSYTAVYFEPPGSWLGDWWTDSVTNHYHYDLKVLVKDSAGNQAEDTVYGVYVSNADPPGGDGDGFGGFGGEAEAMSLDKDGNLYLVSTETPADQIDLRVRKYSPTGESLLAFSAKLAIDSTRIPWPSAIVVDDSLRILVLDGLNNCLKVFDKTGKFLIKVGTRGSGQGQFINPSDLKWDRPHGTKTKLFIADKGNKRVQVLTKQGSFLRQFGTDSIPLNNPIALVHNSYNQTCVLDVQNDTGKLFVYDSTGKLKKAVTSFNLKNPTALTLDSRNNLFIADAGNKRILELSPILTHIYSFGTEGDSFGQFRNPTALSITKDGRYLYVYDRTKRTISKFTMIKSKKRGGGGGQSEELLEILPTQLLLYAPKPNPAKRLVTLKYAVPRQERISLIIYDIVGRQTRTITDKIHKPGFYTQTWDGKDARGRELSAGIYFCLLKDDEKILTKKVVLVR